MCIFYVNMLLKVVGHYDLSVLSVSDGVRLKTVWFGGWVDGVSSIQFSFGFKKHYFNFAKPVTLLLPFRS